MYVMRAGPQLGVAKAARAPPWLHSVMCACKQSLATLVLHATAKKCLWTTFL